MVTQFSQATYLCWLANFSTNDLPFACIVFSNCFQKSLTLCEQDAGVSEAATFERRQRYLMREGL